MKIVYFLISSLRLRRVFFPPKIPQPFGAQCADTQPTSATRDTRVAAAAAVAPAPEGPTPAAAEQSGHRRLCAPGTRPSTPRPSSPAAARLSVLPDGQAGSTHDHGSRELPGGTGDGHCPQGAAGRRRRRQARPPPAPSGACAQAA